MKFREFMVNSLPRIKSKKKKQQQQQQQKQLHPDLDYSPSPAKAKLTDHYNKRPVSEPHPDPIHDTSTGSIAGDLDSACDREDKILLCLKYRIDSNADRSHVSASSPSLNRNCARFKHTLVTDSDLIDRSDLLCEEGEIYHYIDSDNVSLSQSSYNTIPKPRSRIRTNPWVPTPRTTPTGSPLTTPTWPVISANRFSSPARHCFSDQSPPISPRAISRYFGMTSSDILTTSMFSEISADSARGTAPMSEFSCSAISELSADSAKGTDLDSPDSPHFGRSSPSGGLLCIAPGYDMSFGSSDDDDNRFGGSEEFCVIDDLMDASLSGISFEYEEKLENLLENGHIAETHSSLSLRDLDEEEEVILQKNPGTPSDDECYHTLMSKTADRAQGLRKRIRSSNVAEITSPDGGYSSNSSHEELQKLVSCDDVDSAYNSHDTSSSSVLDDWVVIPDPVPSVTSPLHVDIPDNSGFDERSHSNAQINNDIEAMATTPDTPTCNDVLPPTSIDGTKASGRSLTEITTSLESKVLKLRENQRIVQEKVREAQEEERIRMRERQRFQKQLSIHRKQLLLRTLQELKEKLEKQSCRLQTSYSATMMLQRKFVQKSSALNIKLPRTRDATVLS